MRTFTDNAGRTWTIAITVDAIKRVRALANVNLLEVLDGKLIDRLAADPVLLCDVVYAVCKPEEDAQKITDEEFGRSMAGDALDHAVRALLEDVADFTPSRRARENLRRVIATLFNAMDRAQERVTQRLDSGELDAVVDQALQRLNDSSGSSPASLASIPDR